ncbi:porin [Psychromonas algicola]|uniref:porin n=1 Tax=Psychromonas algicola TaxID=2555642 RepID=UPI00106788BD|nr:porin [Psychromonas sp. RZ5]TEW52142.1 porin [Psychromonas sp. RZ5]
MKKTLLASAILASLVSVSAQAATVYDADGQTLKISGDIDVTAYFDDQGDGTTSSDSSTYGSINIFGTTAVSDTTTAYAEFEIDTDGYESNSATEATGQFAIDELVVGLDTAYGDFSFGGVSSALGQVTDFTDVGNEFGGSLETLGGSGATGFAYANTFGGVSVNAEYIASSDEDADSIGVSAVYSLDFGLDIGAGYVVVDEDSEIQFGLGYSVDALYVGFGYEAGEEGGVDFTTMELAVTYGVSDDLTLMAFYGMGDTDDADTLDYYALEASYSLASNVTASAGFTADNLDTATVDNQLYTQISYDF